MFGTNCGIVGQVGIVGLPIREHDHQPLTFGPRGVEEGCGFFDTKMSCSSFTRLGCH